MPELAEVAFYRSRWLPALRHSLTRIHLSPVAPLLPHTLSHSTLSRSLRGKKFLFLDSHGKKLLCGFSPSHWLTLHLGMTGSLQLLPPRHQPRTHDHLILYTPRHALVFNDPRRFGSIEFHHGPHPPDWWLQRPPALLDPRFNRRHLDSILQRHPRLPLKALLLKQEYFPGVGNWMADEILWRARLLPTRTPRSLSRQDAAALLRRTRQVARDALRVIGKDWSDPPPTWLFPHRWRDGGLCPKTKKPLLRQTLAGRTTCFSPAWQR